MAPSNAGPAVAESNSVAAAEVAGPSATVVAGSPIASNAAAVPPPAAALTMPLQALAAHKAPQVLPAGLATTATVLAFAAALGLVHVGTVVGVAALNPAPPSPSTVTPTLHLNGLDLVPGSAREITSLYGRWTYPPGGPSMVQGRQQFDVVDPKTVQSVGTFDALVSTITALHYTSLLVTSNDGTNIGAAAGQQPPVGSLIANFQLGIIGLSYSAMPTPSGNVVSCKITTPSGDIPLALTFDGAKGIADHTVDNRPIVLADGFSIAPADPDAEIITATSGILPLFTTVQGHQVFNVYDSAGQVVGSFDGAFTTTSDIIRTYTQAILVTANDGTNVGTGAGQVPPVGTVYNVIYREADDHYFLYSSLPAPSGDQVSVIEVNKGVVTQSAVTLIDASAPPAESLSGAGGYRFVPVSDLKPSGVNGLPPRDVQIQGYQQFDVYDPSGAKVGSVDADVSKQWDLFGIHSEAILITRVAPGSSGEVPPVGSVFNFVSSGDSGFGAAHSVVPLASEDLTSFKLVTPWGDIPMPSTLRPARSRTDATYFSPFTTV